MNGKQKILIADDSEINRALLMEILGDGYAVSYTHLTLPTT